MTTRPLKILFLGAMAVGKSSLIQRLTTQSFSADYKSTLGVALHHMTIQTDRGPQPLVLWDTDGDAEAAILASPYMRGADAAMIVCDVTRPETAETLCDIAEGMEDRLPGRPILGVVNKIDLQAPSAEQLTRVQRNCGRAATTSALSGDGVAEALAEVVGLCLRRMED